jgi:hypothetical protein
LGITTDFDQIHLALEKLIFPFNLIPKPDPFSFRDYFSDSLYTKIGRAKTRQSCAFSTWFQERMENMNVKEAIGILQTHDLEDPDFDPKKTNTSSLCMHATGITNPSNTTGSMVAEIRKGQTQYHLAYRNINALSIPIYPCLFWNPITRKNYGTRTQRRRFSVVAG